MPSKISRASRALQHIDYYKKQCRFESQIDPAYTAGSKVRPFHGAVFFRIYVCLPINKFFCNSKSFQQTQWRWRDLNPRPSPCKGAALPLSYIPRTCLGLVGLTGFEPVTPALSAQCSNQLSYKPGIFPYQLISARKLILRSSTQVHRM